jgi:2-polyprenyl-6-methoxyphenol hydroxylase-like FAD-dependent oxidoreductase
MDVLWFRISRHADEPSTVDLKLTGGHFVGLIDRRAYWQVAWVIPKGAFEQVRQAGLEAFRASVVQAVPAFADRIAEIADWDSVKLLQVRADRLRRWYRPGYLAIGDAAHAMSPVGGVGINVAIQDAVEAANLLWRPLRQGSLRPRHLARVQRRRELAVRITQAAQSFIQSSVLRPTLQAGASLELPPLVRLLLGTPGLSDLPVRFLAFGILRPHVRSPELAPSARVARPSSAPSG